MRVEVAIAALEVAGCRQEGVIDMRFTWLAAKSWFWWSWMPGGLDSGSGHMLWHMMALLGIAQGRTKPKLLW
jgi:hypothetical protein